MNSQLISLEGVSVWLEDGKQILSDIDWIVREGEHWVVLGPNGAGKSTLFNVATARRYPSRGVVDVVGRRFGEADMLALREMISMVDPHQAMYEWFTVEEVVLTGAFGTVQPQPDRYLPDHFALAANLMSRLGLGGMEEREIKSLSQGERQRVRIARALMPRPRIVALDEPAIGLDLPAREALIAALGDLTRSDDKLATILITHHLEEVPPTCSHALLIANGRVVAAGVIAEVLTSEQVSAAFGIPISVSKSDGRWMARGTPAWS